MANQLDGLFNQVTDDPEVVAAVKDLALQTIAVAREQLADHMAPQIRLQAVRTILPTLVRSLEKNRDAGTDEELRNELKELFKQVRDG